MNYYKDIEVGDKSGVLRPVSGTTERTTYEFIPNGRNTPTHKVTARSVSQAEFALDAAGVIEVSPIYYLNDSKVTKL